MIEKKEIKQIFTIMEQCFPENEHRPYTETEKLIENKKYKIFMEKDSDGNILGFISVWQLDNLNFIEHLAVRKEFRGRGLGSLLVKKCIKSIADVPTVLEVENPEGEIKIKRIKFYERLNFKLNPYFYSQPSLTKGRPEVPMYIMSYKSVLNISEFIKTRDVLYKNIYN